MVIFSLFAWWYTTGWLTLMRKSGMHLQAMFAFFSVPMLLGSLFAPFRQISAGRVEGPLKVQLQAWGDRVFSRFIGAIVRLMLIGVGLVVVSVIAVFSVAAIIAWPIIPFAPAVGLLLVGVGV